MGAAGGKGSATIVGAGVVGLATAAALTREGWAVTLVDRGEPGAATSRGNAGGIAHTDIAPLASPGVWRKVPGWLLDPKGPLAIRPAYALALAPWLWRFLRNGTPARARANAEAMAALQGLAMPAWERLFDEAGLMGELVHGGRLDLFETERAFARAWPGYEEERRYGVELHPLRGAEIRRMEGAVSREVPRAVFTPGWAHVRDPYAISLGLAAMLRERGARILRAEAIAVRPAEAGASVLTADGGHIDGDVVVIAAGAWSGPLAAGLGDKTPLESERGYNVTSTETGVELSRVLGFPSHGFVATPMSVGLRIGGAVEFGGLMAPPNWARIDAIYDKARRFLPDLPEDAGGTRWMGHRPSTPDSQPVIGRSSASGRVLYAFGHGHYGLTQSAATGEIIADLIAERTPPIELAPYRPTRF